MEGLSFGLAGISAGTVEQPFIDWMKFSKPMWAMYSGDQWNQNHPALIATGVLDEDGWPTELPASSTGIRFLFALPTGEPTRSMVMTYEGTGTIVGAGSEVSSKRFEFTMGAGNKWFDITATDPGGAGDYIRNVRIFRADQEALLDSGEIFNPEFLRVIEGAHVIRFMDWMKTNWSTEEEWADRPKVSDVTWAPGETVSGVRVNKGPPVEIMVALANKIGADPWFCMPHMATDEYVTEFATIVRDTLDPTLRANVEYSNETWNFGFGQYGWLRTQVATAILDVSSASGTPEVDEEVIGGTSGARGWFVEDRGGGVYAVEMVEYGPIVGGSLQAAGSSYANGTYTNVPLTGGSGSGAQATIVVSGGVVTSVTRTNNGDNYEIGDVLSASNANLGGTGSGFAWRVTNVDGTAKPRFALSETIEGQTSGFTATVDAREWGIPDPSGNEWIQYSAKKSVEFAQLWNAVYGYTGKGNPRLYHVMNVQQGYEGLALKQLTPTTWEDEEPGSYVAPNTVIDAIAITTYFGGTHTSNSTLRAELIAYIDTHTYEETFDWLTDRLLNRDDIYGTVPDLEATYADWRGHADTLGMDLVAYEGGSHEGHSFGITMEPGQLEILTPFYSEYSYSQQITTVYEALRQVWAQYGDSAFMQFVDVATPSQYGSWGMRRFLSDLSPRSAWGTSVIRKLPPREGYRGMTAKVA